jgi:hypothetical protein
MIENLKKNDPKFRGYAIFETEEAESLSSKKKKRLLNLLYTRKQSEDYREQKLLLRIISKINKSKMTTGQNLFDDFYGRRITNTKSKEKKKRNWNLILNIKSI